MTRHLPPRPHLDHLRTQAKALLAQLKEGDREAAAAFIEHLPAARQMTPAQVRKAGFKLADAQSVVARKAGFSSWPALVRHVELLRQMEGAWEFLDLEVDGNPMPVPSWSSSRMLIDGDRFRMESPEANYDGVFTIDAEQIPHQIDIEFIEGPEAGNWSYGLFELAGDRFKICLGLTGASRPRGFTTSPGSGHALENLRRVARTRPEGVDGGKRQTHQPAPPVAPADTAAFELKMTPLLAKLQGVWLPVQLVQNGQELVPMMLSIGSRSFTGNETKVVFGGQAMLHAKMRLDESQAPVAVDYLGIGRSQNGQITLGVLEWVGEDVRICMAAPGQPRPSDFSCEKGSGRTLSQWKRKG